MDRVSVVIVNWNGRQFLEPCLRSVQTQTFRDFEVIVVDNHSTDGSVEFLESAFGWVRLIRNAENKGFAAANNQAIHASAAPFVATLNNDARPEPDWLHVLVEAMESKPDVGACASKMLFADRPGIINSAGIAIDRAGIAWDRLGGIRDCPGETTPQEVFGACAGAALYRRAMLDQIGLFDDDFFAYLEDVDLAWRAQAAGWRAIYLPSARVIHHHSGTSIEGSPLKSRLLGRNKVWLIARNYPWPQWVWYGPIIVAYDLGSVVFALLRGDVNPAVGRWWGILGLPRILRGRTKSRASVLRRMEPLAAPWTVWRRYRHLRRTDEAVGNVLAEECRPNG
jgi:GT2 family glycosyltransferase